MKFLIYSVVYAGSALMAFNIFLYLRFAKDVRKRGSWNRESRILSFPIFLLVLFLAGYLAVGIFGKPDIIMSGILFGGSIFVFVMLWLIRQTVDRIQESEHLKAKLSAAEEASKAKTFFLSNMSHDLRTPLNAIIGYTTIAKTQKLSLEKHLEIINKIDMAGRQLLEIVNAVLEMSRIESGKFDVMPERLNIKDCVAEAGELVKNQFAQKSIDFSFLCEVSHEWVRCDRRLLDRTLTNLLSNAGKFTDENGRVTLSLKELSYKDNFADYEIRVKDNGIGMSEEFVKDLFSPFERERTSTVSKTQGTGLGMSITKSMIDIMHGKIEVFTEKGNGTEFVINLSFPLEGEDDKANSATEEIRFDGKRVLLAEDNEINMEIAEMLLSEVGFTIETAQNGHEAVEKLASSDAGYYDLVLTDIQMPVMDGYDEARAIRSLPDPQLSQIPIIAMTANAFKEDKDAAIKAGMNGHITKPLNLDDMLSTIKCVLSPK
ncbi:MAG: response regulator [Clostridia bacterium]|nr:response regulator [Clostridia bacterium]